VVNLRLAVHETEKLHGEQLLSLLTQPAIEGNQYL